MSRQDEARKELKKLEDDPKHTNPGKDVVEQTRNDDINDPKFNKKDGEMDKKWHKDGHGNWSHPDFE